MTWMPSSRRAAASRCAHSVRTTQGLFEAAISVCKELNLRPKAALELQCALANAVREANKTGKKKAAPKNKQAATNTLVAARARPRAYSTSCSTPEYDNKFKVCFVAQKASKSNTT